MTKLSLCLAAFVAASCSFGQSVSLRLNLPAGNSYAYTFRNKIKSEGQMTVANGTATQTMTTTLKVLSKGAQGTRIQTKVTGVKVTSDGKGLLAQQVTQQAKSLEGVTSEAVYDDRAQAVSESAASRAAALGFTGLLGVLFPSGPVRPGGTWSSKVDFDKIFSAAGQGMVQAGRNKTVPVQFKLARLQKLGSKTLAHITYTMKGNLDVTIGGSPQAKGMPMKVAVDMKGQYVVDAATGLPREGKSAGTTKMLVSGMTLTQILDTSYRLK